MECYLEFSDSLLSAFNDDKLADNMQVKGCLYFILWADI